MNIPEEKCTEKDVSVIALDSVNRKKKLAYACLGFKKPFKTAGIAYSTLTLYLNIIAKVYDIIMIWMHLKPLIFRAF